MPVYLIRAPAIRALKTGDDTPIGTVEATQRGNEWGAVNVDVPAGVDPGDYLDELLARGAIAEWRPESVIVPYGGTIYPTEENWMGRDFPAIGITPDWQRAVDYGRDVILAIADTDDYMDVARDAHFPDVEIVNLYGGTAGRHGHRVFCSSRMVGPLGALPGCTKLYVAAALPGGSGSTTTVVGAIRACWQAVPKPHALSLSLGMVGRDPVIDGEIIAAQRADVPCSAAMGNDGWSITSPGSPAAVCRYAWGASTFDGRAPASFSTGGSNLEVETGSIPGEQVGGAHIDGGFSRGNGTSFSCPPGTAIVAAAHAKGWVV